MTAKWKTFLLLALTLGMVLTLGPQPEGHAAPKATARSQSELLFQKAWQLVHDNFYDETFNGQSWQRWQRRYAGKLRTGEDAHKAIESMLASLGDRYTRFLDKTQFDEEKSQIDARVTGIGVQIGFDKSQHIVVISPVEDSPAAKAGLSAGDEIMAIDGNSTKGLSLEEASRKIRGPVGTQVSISIMREKEPREYRITRAEIATKSVHAVRMLNSDIGYIRLGTFMSNHAGQEVRDALARLSPARGIILDLRGNPGGLVTNAIDISSMFLDGGIVVSTVDRHNAKQATHVSMPPISKQPLVVLIDKGTASAAEITSGALRDSGRAELVGEQSFGKGLVQAIHKLDDGSGINLTIARYVTPNNTDINKKGIVPDHLLELSGSQRYGGKGPWWYIVGDVRQERSPERSEDLQLQKAITVLEGKIKNAQPEYSLKLDLWPRGLSGGQP